MNAASSLRRLATAHWPLALACAFFLLVGALVFDDYGVGFDTGSQRAIGEAALDYLAGEGERALDHPKWPIIRYFGAAFEVPLVLILERILGLEDSRDIHLGRHILTHLFFLAGGVFCYLLVLRLFNSRALALIAMVLFLLHPRIYAHSVFNPRDVPFAAMFMVTLYLVHRAFRRDTLAAFAICGAATGLLVNLRIMGSVLFVAVLVLCALDLSFAKGADGRRRALLTGGVFALTAVLTYYASLPVLWTDPIGRFPDLVDVLRSRPVYLTNLFRGEVLPSVAGPPLGYVPVWVGITTPPATLLLALAGGVALAWRALRRPRDGPLRFGLLLLALPIVTMVAVFAFETNIATGWRYLYFLYAPLSLLAVFGLRRLASAPRGRWPRAGAYALTGAAIAVTAVSMFRIHPHQNNYFNFLVDRTTPERLNSRYTMNYWAMSGYDLLRDIVRDHPSESLSISLNHLGRYRATLPVDDRKRIFGTRDFRSGERNFYAIHPEGCSAPAPPAPVSYVSRIYASTLNCVVDPVSWFGRFRLRALASGEPLVRSTYHIHRDGSGLTYLRDGCPAEDVGRRFFLHVTPVDAGDLPPARAGHGFDNWNFSFGSRIDGNCIAIARLPGYPIASIHTGQFSGDGVYWEVEFTSDGQVIVPPTPNLARARQEALASEPLASSVFNVYRDGRTLTYVRDGCSAEETATRFFLHIDPDDPDDLPAHRREHGFDNLDFTLGRNGARVDGNCIAVARLPGYPIASVRTGQYDATGSRWEVEFTIPVGE